MKPKIPKSYQLGGIEWKVRHGVHHHSEGNLGHTDFMASEIIIKNKFNNQRYCKQQQEQTFFHELVHSILITMNEHDLNNNEQFVDIFGQLLYQFSKSAKWK